MEKLTETSWNLSMLVVTVTLWKDICEANDNPIAFTFFTSTCLISQYNGWPTVVSSSYLQNKEMKELLSVNHDTCNMTTKGSLK